MISTTTRLATLAVLLLPLVSATFTFNAAYPSHSFNTTDNYAISDSWGLSSACKAAYNAEIPCDKLLIENNGIDDITPQNHQDLCTDECINGLRKWRDTIQAKCSTDDVKAAASQLDLNNGSIMGADGPLGALLVTGISDPKLAIVEQLYFMYCMRDLNTGDLCPAFSDDIDSSSDSDSDSSSDSSSDQQTNTTLCADTCITQGYVLIGIIEQSYGPSEFPAGHDLKTLCPGLDTSKYPEILSQKPTSSYMFDSSSSNGATNGGATNGGATNTSAANTPKGNAAATLNGSLCGMGSIVAAVAIAMFVF